MYCIIDLETTDNIRYDRKGHFLYNEILAVGMKSSVLSSQPTTHLFFNCLDSFTVLVGHNIKYDLLYLWQDPRLLNWFQKGGTIWDTMIAEYVLTGQQSKFAKLRDISVNKYECAPRKKHIDDLLFNKDRCQEYKDKYKSMLDIPIELIYEDVEGDVLDTEKVYLQQFSQSKKNGQYILITELMDSVLATTEMEFNGVYIDRIKLEENEKALQSNLDRLVIETNSLIRPYWYD